MEKVYEISEKTKLTYGRGYVYSLQYHLIWCTKYRKKVLTDEMAEKIVQAVKEGINRRNRYSM